MATPICGHRAIDGTYHAMKPDCDRRNADIYAGRLPANLENGTPIFPANPEEDGSDIIIHPGDLIWMSEDEIITADIVSGEPVERDSFIKWIAIGAVMSLGAVAAGIAGHFWRVL